MSDPQADGPALAELIADFATCVMKDGAPERVRSSVGQRVLDILGLQAAALELPTSVAAAEFATQQGGAGQAHCMGSAVAVPAPAAAFVNGVLAHSLDYDDTHLPSVLHPSASVVPAALAAAELAGADGDRLLNAVGVGIETVVRLGMAGYDERSKNSVFFEHGQHATSICGVIGSAVSAAAVLGLGHDGIVNAIGIAASMAGGILEANRTGGTVKRLHCGWAAQNGVSAAMLVERGFTGPPTALEGRFGFFEAFLHGTVDLSAVTEGLGTKWSVPDIFFKPYPANHFTHTALDAAARLRERGLAADDVEEAVLGVAAPTVRTIGEPLEVKQRPQTGYQAQFSGPYMVAVGLLGGGGLGAGLDDFRDELAREPRRCALMARVRVEADPECSEIFPYQFPAVLRVRTRDGSELVEKVLVNRGGPDDPLSDADLLAKFRDNASRTLPPDVVNEVVEHVAQLADVQDVGQLIPRQSLGVTG